MVNLNLNWNPFLFLTLRFISLLRVVLSKFLSLRIRLPLKSLVNNRLLITLSLRVFCLFCLIRNPSDFYAGRLAGPRQRASQRRHAGRTAPAGQPASALAGFARTPSS